MGPIHLSVRDDVDGKSGMRSRQDESDPITGTGKVMGGSVETLGEEAESGGVSRLEKGVECLDQRIDANCVCPIGVTLRSPRH